MTDSDSGDVFDRVAVDLDRVAGLADAELVHAVRVDGSCGWLATGDQAPGWTGDDRADRVVAARVCAGCPVQRECLEWDLRGMRAHGEPATAGVWGPLAPQDRRRVFVRWLDRRGGGHPAGGR
ncbi:hypothetical protein GCM10022243_10020 [Saccharothrix violaceirubra]|uniref:WhiB family redox-sensing transcriptional regulator n=1 Tax=Saccharothrix violaceirubra TaxID=413306 RepID=A0A7W7T4H7_9PSEU|nr:WhiB family transcriptional regulator [Saccharothrix violaceirubra]MBB4966161.1 WhiB family redox-sensing transcriptional regulator [Saccharothrix violaceirubra]